MHDALRTLIHDYGWFHTGIGLIGNLLFLIGSVLFLPRYSDHQTFGVWLFIVGSGLMLVGALGQFLVKLVKNVD